MFWNAVLLLIRLRLRLAVRSLTHSAAAVSAVAFGVFLLVPAAIVAGQYCYRGFAESPAQAAALLPGVLLIIQLLWLILLIPGVGVALGRTMTASDLQLFPLRPFQAIVAGVLGSLLEAPSPLVLPVFFAVTAGFGNHSFVKVAAILLILALFSLQIVALREVLEQGWIAVSRARRLRAPFLLALALLGVFLFRGTPSALAAAAPETKISAALRGNALPGAAFFPSGIAARGIAAASQGRTGASAGAIALLTALTAGFLLLADRLRCAAERSELSSSGRMFPLTLSPGFSRPEASQISAVIGAELRCLVREPAAHLPLRSPGLLILICFVGWISPNLGNDRFANLRDLLGMVSLLYLLVWQVQLLCNRFGNEAGRAGMLFGFPTPRCHLLLGRNAALLALLIPLDSAMVTAGCFAAHAPQWIAPITGWGVLGLIVFTAFGNIVSVRQPFPIRRHGERFHTEPERSLAFVYFLLGFATFAALWPAAWAIEQGMGVVTVPLTALCVGALYAGSVLWAERLLTQNERRVIRLLDRE